jgi:hypothetical protein
MLATVALVMPNTAALALSRHGEAAGTAAAVVWAVQFSVGSLLTPLVGLLGNNGGAIAVVMTGATAVALLGFAPLFLRGGGTGARHRHQPSTSRPGDLHRSEPWAARAVLAASGPVPTAERALHEDRGDTTQVTGG